MSLKDELARLTQERDVEARHTVYIYARLKQDIRRKISPRYIIRKHIGTSLTAATLLGFLAAPSHGAASTRAQPRRRNPLWRIILSQIPGLSDFIPHLTDPEPQAPAPQPAPKPTSWRSALLAYVLPLLTQLDWSLIFTNLMQACHGRTHPEPEETEIPPENPTPPKPAASGPGPESADYT